MARKQRVNDKGIDGKKYQMFGQGAWVSPRTDVAGKLEELEKQVEQSGKKPKGDLGKKMDDLSKLNQEIQAVRATCGKGPFMIFKITDNSNAEGHPQLLSILDTAGELREFSAELFTLAMR